MTKSIFLNAKIDEITEINKMKNEYRNAVNVKVKEIVTLINMTINNERNE